MSETSDATTHTWRGGEDLGVVPTEKLLLDEPLELACGEVLSNVEVAYTISGELNAEKSNAVLICHALSGDAQVAGYPETAEPDDPNAKAGWWDLYVGPGKAVDTHRYCVICSNVLGGCKGTTGPSSINPDTGRPWGLAFPLVTVADMVEAQRRLIDHLGIEQLLCVLGGSMGGMQALEWAVRYPDRVRSAIPIATTASLNAQSLAFDAVGRNAILSDPNFCNGAYAEDRTVPREGLAIARMLGHITYLSEEGMERKFGRSLRYRDKKAYDFESEFSVETYLDYQGEKFVDRFDANSYLYITRAMDYFDLGEGRGGVVEALRGTDCGFLVMSFTSDWLFPPRQSQQLVAALAQTGKTVSYVNIETDYGHDSFLLKSASQERAIRGFLDRFLYKARTNEPKAARREILTPEVDERRRLDLERVSQFIEPGHRVLDLGCGDGLYLQHLRYHGSQEVQGVDVDEIKVLGAIERGVDVIQADIDRPLDLFPAKSFDRVVLSRTLQTIHRPVTAMRETLRIGKRGVVSFPNFGYWRNRRYVAFFGRVPVSRNLPFSWIDTPNIRHLSLKDFEDWCRGEGVSIEQRLAFDYAGGRDIHWLPNLRATDVIYVVSRSA